MLRPFMLTVLAVLTLAGCGRTMASLSVAERSQLATINFAFAMTALNGSHFGATLKGTDELIELCRRKRDAVYETSNHHSKTVKEILEDDANTIRQYQPDIAAQLDHVIAANCT